VVFERLRRSYASGQAARQQLLVASAVEVGVRGRARLEEASAEVERFGFEIEPFGEAAVLVRAVPALLAHMDPAMLVRDLAEELLEVESTQSVQEALDRVFARLACHSAVRVGQTLSHEQFRALLEAMDEAELPGNCPHGRPAFLRWPRVELERLFRRV
jgi:DNA mismatch repair protein MutL